MLLKVYIYKLYIYVYIYIEYLYSLQAAPLTENSQPAKPEPAKEAISPRQTQEYQVAMELELWKEHQESLFQGQVCHVYLKSAVDYSEMSCLYAPCISVFKLPRSSIKS